jgi:hypothetical protein
MRFVAALLALTVAAAHAAAAEGDYPTFSIGRGIVSASISTGEASLRLRARAHPERGEQWRVPELRVEWQDEEVGTLLSTEGSATHFPAKAGMVELDPANDTPEFFLQAYTGGAHCCSELQVLTKSLTGPWQAVEVGMFDGGEVPVEDIDLDGRFEVVTEDAAFHYAFGCYACSAAPLQILMVQGGATRDVTFEPRYLAAHREFLEKMEEGVNLREAGNGFLAGWVAEKIILGEGAQAWAEMLLAYNRNDEWGLVSCPEGKEECPESEQIKKNFPDALRELLSRRGYPL